jgi:protein-S-isoprenylcysteine O-methyltransferase Ste14
MEKNVNEIREFISAKENLANAFGTLMAVVIAIICVAFIPFKIMNSESHTVIAEIGNFRFIGPTFILIGIVGYLACCWNFIFDAKGIPALEGMQKHLIVKGLYKYVRNPIYISLCLIIFGEAVYFQSQDLLLYLLGWMVVFHIRVVFFEEPYLSVTFGESYEWYRESVRRWIPRLKAYNIETN